LSLSSFPTEEDPGSPEIRPPAWYAVCRMTCVRGNRETVRYDRKGEVRYTLEDVFHRTPHTLEDVFHRMLR